jgi:hypothetical protein
MPRRLGDVRVRFALAPIETKLLHYGNRRAGRVEDGRGNYSHSATPRFPSPLIEPDVPISGIRLSDWVHRMAHDGAASGRRSRRKSPRSP